MCLVDLLQHMWRTGEIPQELVWMILVLITKETTDTRGIVLLETLWKVVEALIDTCPTSAYRCTASSTSSGPEEGWGRL